MRYVSKIVVMNEDNIVEMATHEELLQIESRMYKTLYNMRLKK